MLIPMRVSSLAMDPERNMPVMVLRDQDGRQTLTLWIGIFEASAISAALDQLEFSRPMTHDLLVSLLTALGGRLESVEIYDLRDEVFFATLHVLAPSGMCELEARPSDAIALAARLGCPLLVREQVLERAAQRSGLVGYVEPPAVQEARWVELLENLPERDFGRYKM
jgi:bifunctional DNase/RNase